MPCRALTDWLRVRSMLTELIIRAMSISQVGEEMKKFAYLVAVGAFAISSIAAQADTAAVKGKMLMAPAVRVSAPSCW